MYVKHRFLIDICILELITFSPLQKYGYLKTQLRLSNMQRKHIKQHLEHQQIHQILHTSCGNIHRNVISDMLAVKGKCTLKEYRSKIIEKAHQQVLQVEPVK